jgi:hypothetical protein
VGKCGVVSYGADGADGKRCCLQGYVGGGFLALFISLVFCSTSYHPIPWLGVTNRKPNSNLKDWCCAHIGIYTHKKCWYGKLCTGRSDWEIYKARRVVVTGTQYTTQTLQASRRLWLILKDAGLQKYHSLGTWVQLLNVASRQDGVWRIWQYGLTFT